MFTLRSALVFRMNILAFSTENSTMYKVKVGFIIEWIEKRKKISSKRSTEKLDKEMHLSLTIVFSSMTLVAVCVRGYNPISTYPAGTIPKPDNNPPDQDPVVSQDW